MKYRIAVGTVDGIEITEHFGRGRNFRIYEIDQEKDSVKTLVDISVNSRDECNMASHDEFLEEKIQALLDWKVKIVLVSKIGPGAERQLIKNGIQSLSKDGKVDAVLQKVKTFYAKQPFEE